MPLAELVEPTSPFPRCAVQEALGGLFETRHLPVPHGFVVHLPRICVRHPGRLVGQQIADMDQLVQADEQRIAGHRTVRGVRGVAEAGGRQWQNLPECLLRTDQKVHKAVAGQSQGADAVGAGQRGGMEQDPARSFRQFQLLHARQVLGKSSVRAPALIVVTAQKLASGNHCACPRGSKSLSFRVVRPAIGDRRLSGSG